MEEIEASFAAGGRGRGAAAIAATTRRLQRGAVHEAVIRRTLAFQYAHDFRYGVPIPRRGWHAIELIDLAQIADRLHVAAVHPEDELPLRRHHPH